ncbi:hypothetical protein HMPREF9337_02138 [Cutibacterium acnes HL096PA3]|uniref:Uncharacterized protein n=1 Tax=Cutibacterium modestum HL044PA1 TaxID=765109 RepID=A0ABP2K823_9ACTN|nr:hypothetical protein HMPREF9607_01477 [Cutibacterium modestum HL044PA1]EFT20991.1 hypothetical protein HMPREF9566_01169 [Cutibacterium acnes HL045PA1]EGE68689.1 hypothetical protein HMPREF9337_02138 [Cutibacterium acnes HL096PA3]
MRRPAGSTPNHHPAPRIISIVERPRVQDVLYGVTNSVISKVVAPIMFTSRGRATG